MGRVMGEKKRGRVDEDGRRPEWGWVGEEKGKRCRWMLVFVGVYIVWWTGYVYVQRVHGSLYGGQGDCVCSWWLVCIVD